MTPKEILKVEKEIVLTLKNIYDPEIPVNIYDLGLIYEIDYTPDGVANIRMTLTAPNCRQGIIAGAVLAFARALGEYGATSMVAGYTPGKTATISTTVYQLWQLNNDELALKWVLVNVGISAVILLVVNMLERKNLLTAASRGRKSAA